jgi:peptidoglycan/LPS O-acetylase OafA/YrhL
VLVSPAARSLGRLRGLDGLRALAVAAVVGYHLGFDRLPGGFLGVEIFFVISGYLITALLVAEWSDRGGIRLGSFWARRARRLLPALFAMLLGTLAIALVAFPGEIARLRGDVVAASAYVTNWYLVFGHQPYFETVGRPSPLLHLWSLAIEEQFYLVWPILLGLALLVAGRAGAFALVIVGIVASTAAAFALYAPGDDPSRVYYGTDTRAAGLLAGAALALLYVPRESWFPPAPSRAARTAADIVAAAALVAVVATFALVDEADARLYRGGMLMLDGVTVALIAAVVSPTGRIVSGLLETPPIRWLGTRSYAIYLWHWPIFAFTRPGIDIPLDGPANVAVRLLLTAVLAEASYWLVERPIRDGALGRAWGGWRSRPGHGPRSLLDVRVGVTLASFAVVSLFIADVVTASAPTRPDEVPVAAIDGMVTAPPTSEDGRAVAAAGGGSEGDEAGNVAGTPSAAPSGASTRSVAPTSSGAPAPLGRVAVEGPVVGIGESVLIASAPTLARVLGPFDVDAAIGRQVADDVAALRARAAKGRLGRTVILNIGNNGPIFARDAEAAMEVLKDVPIVAWINVAVPRQWEDRNNRTIAAYAERYPNVRLVDWHAASQGRRDLFGDDDVHPNARGARVLALLVADALR